MTGLTREDKIIKYGLEEKVKEMEEGGAVVEVIDYGRGFDLVIANVE